MRPPRERTAARAAFGVIAVWFPLAGFLAAAPAAGQAEAGAAALDAVDALMVAGRTEDARTRLTGWWDAAGRTPEGPPRAELQRALWLRGLLTVDPTQATLDYQRLVVEHPAGPWTDDALLRLAHAAEAYGETARATHHLDVLLRDHPTSPLRLEAGRLLREIHATSARAASVDQRAGPAPSSVTEPVADWTVQVGAFASPVRARALRDELVTAGVDARVVRVPGSPLLRVRAGRFTDEDGSEALRRGLLARGLDATLFPDAEREEGAP